MPDPSQAGTSSEDAQAARARLAASQQQQRDRDAAIAAQRAGGIISAQIALEMQRAGAKSAEVATAKAECDAWRQRGSPSPKPIRCSATTTGMPARVGILQQNLSTTTIVGIAAGVLLVILLIVFRM